MNTSSYHAINGPSTTTAEQAERIYVLWDKYLKEGDMKGMASIYAEDATVQSPLVPAFFGAGKGICRGRAEVIYFLEETVRRRPNDKVHWQRDGFLWNGRRLVWEYPSETPYGDLQVDLAECMDLHNGLIRNHRIYWGWNAVEGMKTSWLKKVAEGTINQNLLAPMST